MGSIQKLQPHPRGRVELAGRTFLTTKFPHQDFPVLSFFDNYWDIFPALHASVMNFVVDKFQEACSIGKITSSRKNSFIYDESKVESKLNSLKTYGGLMRVKQVAKGYEFSIPLATDVDFNLGYNVFRELGVNLSSYSDEQRSALTKAYYKIWGSMLGLEVFDPNKSVDKFIDKKVVHSAPGFDFEKFISTYVPKQEDDFKAGKTVITGFRFVSSPCLKNMAGERVSEIEVAPKNKTDTKVVKEKKAATLEELPAEARLDYVLEIMRARHFTIYVVVALGYEAAEYMTQTPRNSINLSDLSFWLTQWSVGYTQNNYMYDINPIRNIQAVNIKTGAVGKPKANKEHLLMTEDGDILFIPESNHVDLYSQLMEDFGQTKDGEYAPIDTKIEGGRHTNEDGTLRKLPANMFVYSDWLNNKISYTDTSGILIVEDADAYMSYKPSHANSFLSSPMWGGGQYDFDYVANNLSKSIAHLVKLNEGAFKKIFSDANIAEASAQVSKGDRPDYVAQFTEACNNFVARQSVLRLLSDVQAITSFFQGSNQNLPQAAIWEENFKWGDITKNSTIKVFSMLWEALNAAYTVIMKDLDYALSQYSIRNGMLELATLTVIVKYAPKLQEIKKIDFEERKNYLEPPLDDLKKYVPQDIALAKNIAFLPHQAKAFNYLKNVPENAILSIAAGGGKTILVISDLLQLLARGKVKKPIVVCPSHLVKDYIKEANYVTKGRLNVIPVNSAILKSWGEDRLNILISKAPINTFVVTDYDFLAYRQKGTRFEEVSYGSSSVLINLNVEMLRALGFDGIWVDESHFSANASSGRSKGLFRLMSDIPIKRLASGTLTSNVLSDIAGQFKLLDPSIFGNVTKFDEIYGNGSGYQNGAERQVKDRMAEFSNVIDIRRKEWAALLPERKEYFVPVELTPKQREVYDVILQETLDKIAEFLKENPEVAKMAESQDETVNAALEALLHPYLQRLEQYLTAPAADASGEGVLIEEDDKKSAKAKAVAEIANRHLKEKRPGKILVYTQYVTSAETIYNQLPPALKAKCILYKASNKFKDVSEFENNPEKVMMVGVEKSLNTGLNLQFCSVLIRVETVWSPGNLEQGESRINRPSLKGGKDPRPYIYYYWLTCNRTIDITKTARLISKVVSSAKFAESHDPKYQMLPNLPRISMSLDSIRQKNDFNDPDGLMDYITTAFEPLKQLEQEGFDEYRKTHKTESIKIPDGKVLPGSKILKHVPYTSAMEIYGMEELGLVRYQDYVRQETHKDTFEGEVDDFDPVDLQIHTEFGDGVCTGSSGSSLRIKLSDGDKISMSKLKCFVITKKTTNSRDIRQHLVALTGLDAAAENFVKKPEIEDEEEEKEKPIKKLKTKDKNEEEGVNLHLTVFNNIFSVAAYESEETTQEINVLKSFGFQKNLPYLYTEIKRASQLRELIDLMARKYKVPPTNLKAMEDIYTQFKAGKNQLHAIHPKTINETRLFFREKIKPQPSDVLMPYMLFQEDSLYMLFDISRHPATKTVKQKLKGVSGILWEVMEDEWLWISGGSNKAEVKTKILDVNKTLKVLNLEEVKKDFNNLKILKKKST